MRLIDADTLRKSFESRANQLWNEVHDDYSEALYYECIADIDLINDAPTVSTPYLIHCQDCEYWEVDNAQDFSSTNMGMAPCRLKSDTYLASPFDFCSNAKERMPWYD